MLEKEIFRLKVKSSNQVVEEFIGNINNERLEKNKKEILYPNNDCKEKETTNKSNKLKTSQYLDQNE